jgi:hypothetical protein
VGVAHQLLIGRRHLGTRDIREGVSLWFFDCSRIGRIDRRAIGGLPVQGFKHLVDQAEGDRKGLNVFLLSWRLVGSRAYHSNGYGFRLIQGLLRDRFLALLALLSRLSGFFGPVVYGFIWDKHRLYQLFRYFPYLRRG